VNVDPIFSVTVPESVTAGVALAPPLNAAAEALVVNEALVKLEELNEHVELSE
jgi:BioD-like phosphotransacetylase family protein